jgi:hypothetical protein
MDAIDLNVLPPTLLQTAADIALSAMAVRPPVTCPYSVEGLLAITGFSQMRQPYIITHRLQLRVGIDKDLFQRRFVLNS